VPQKGLPDALCSHQNHVDLQIASVCGVFCDVVRLLKGCTSSTENCEFNDFRASCMMAQRARRDNKNIAAGLNVRDGFKH
jgi:hypothetical protein